MVRIVLLDEHMAVEPSHLRNGEHADGAKGTCGNRKHLSLCNVGSQLVVCRALEAVEGNAARLDVSFQCSLGYFDWKSPGHNHLVLHLTEGQLSGSSVSAVEAHECILKCVIKFALDISLVHILGHGVVDVQKGNRILADNRADVLAERSVDINLTGHRDSLGCQAAVHIAGHETELCLECGPAFSGNGHIFSVALVLLHPIL